MGTKYWRRQTKKQLTAGAFKGSLEEFQVCRCGTLGGGVLPLTLSVLGPASNRRSSCRTCTRTVFVSLSPTVGYVSAVRRWLGACRHANDAVAHVCGSQAAELELSDDEDGAGLALGVGSNKYSRGGRGRGRARGGGGRRGGPAGRKRGAYGTKHAVGGGRPSNKKLRLLRKVRN